MEETAGYKEERDCWETSYWPENNEMTNALESCAQCQHLNREPGRSSVFLWLVTSGNTAVHLMAFHMSITLTLSMIRILYNRELQR